MKKILLLILTSLLLTNCTVNRSHVGATLGATTTTGSCVSGGIDNPYAIAACALTGALVGAEVMYKSDQDVHNAVFVDHLNTDQITSPSYTNWYNSKTGNSGIIKTTSSYLKGPIKCKDYNQTIDITSSWPMMGVGNIDRQVNFGTACQMPDGRWIIQ